MKYTHVIAEFGRRMGLPALRLERDRPLRLTIEGMGALFLEEGEDGADEILICLAREFPPHDREALRRALLLCGPTPIRPFTVSAGLYKSSTLVFMTRFDRGDFSLQKLEQAVPVLSSLLDKALSA